MKKLLVLSLILINMGFAQIKIIDANNIVELLKHKNKIISVKGKITNTALSTTGKTRYLNFSDDYTKSFKGVVFSRHLKNFTRKDIKPLEEYKGKEVIITGKIKIYKESPEIIIAFPKQIKIIDEE